MSNVELYSTSFFADANLVSYWRLNGNATDEKNANNGTATDITYHANNGKFSQGITGNGTSSNIALPNNASLKPTSFTINAWVKTTTSVEILVNENEQTGNYRGGYRFLVYDKKISLDVCKGDSIFTISMKSGSSNVDDGNWHMLSVTYNGSNKATAFYLDGQPDGTATQDNTLVYRSTSYPYIGALYLEYTGGGTPYAELLPSTSSIDDVALFSRILSVAEISTLYNYSVNNSVFFGTNF